ncbi:hypothetical protein [Leptospira kmetyi]|uniref:hypothetical protein n=1 Tax=Leptospira kmetyi TaxID=408139 RepID=UPI0010840FA8|nr:hypothetical protein [Leptospira kmetyi]TGL73141.1 hypothetical protein EHQ67_00035 [Leptospira kmetyi]
MNNKSFEYVVENALDFLSRSIKDFDSSPKYSIINFHASIELFLKVRLMAEHWSLVVAKGKEPDLDKFLTGDFQSVTFQDAIDRLRKVAKVNISDELAKSIDSLSKHRNKTMHFFHEAHSDPNSTNLKIEIAKEQLSCWYHMHSFLSNECKDTFLSWIHSINAINGEFKKQKEFLKIIFEKLQDEVAQQKGKGVSFKKCPSCDFESLPDKTQLNSLIETRCLVCDISETVLLIKCPNCDHLVICIDEGYAECPSCLESLDPEKIADSLSSESDTYDYFDDSDDRGNCSFCGGHQVVIRSPNSDDYFCTQCFYQVDVLEHCHWCNELNTGDMSNTGIFGCDFCYGSSNYD